MTSHTFSLCICLFCFFHSTNQTFQLGKGLPSGRKKGLRRESGKPLSGESEGRLAKCCAGFTQVHS
jgi:hypothetical protein